MLELCRAIYGLSFSQFSFRSVGHCLSNIGRGKFLSQNFSCLYCLKKSYGLQFGPHNGPRLKIYASFRSILGPENVHEVKCGNFEMNNTLSYMNVIIDVSLVESCRLKCKNFIYSSRHGFEVQVRS